MTKDLILYVTKILLYIFGIIIGIGLFIGFIMTWIVQNSMHQEIFLQGRIPDPVLNGYYEGTSSNYIGSWRGKLFNADTSSGINHFGSSLGIGDEDRNTFDTYIGHGLHDKSLRVLKLEYDIAQNPIWMRLLMDEVVQIEDNKYLGKVSLRIIPGFPFAISYFRLQK